jgi:hypothetical protein
VVVVAASCETSVDRFRFAAINRQPIEPATPIEYKVFAISRPVWRFDVIQGMIDNAAVFGTNRHSFKRAVKHWLCSSGPVPGFQRNATEFYFLESVVVVRAHAKADVKQALKLQAHECAARC